MRSSIGIALLGLLALLLQAAAKSESIPIDIIGGCALGAGLVGIVTSRGQDD